MAMVPSDERSFKPVDLNISEIKTAIPSHLFERNTARGFRYLARDLVQAVLLAAAVYNVEVSLTSDSGFFTEWVYARIAVRYFVWSLYWWFQGLTFTGLWVIGHECGHGAFSASAVVCDTLGFVLHTALWTPYFSWRISHHRHHANHASMEKDEVYVPPTRSDLGIPKEDGNKHIDYTEYFEDTPIYTLFMLIRQQIFAFPAYLLFNISGQKSYPKWTNHFNPGSILFRESQWGAVMLSNLGIAIMIYLTRLACAKVGTLNVIRYYGLPWLAVTHWFVMITYLHHTAPYIPHYRKGAWTYVRGAAATVDRDFLGWQGRFFLHDVAHFHVIHHFFPKMPFYHGEEATQHLRKILGDNYLYSKEAVFPALWESYNECQFVEDEGDILFYKNKKGEQTLHLRPT